MSNATAKWLRYGLGQQGYFAHATEGIVLLGRAVLRHGAPELQAALPLIASNSIHYHWLPDAVAVRQVQCMPARRGRAESCLHHLTLEHLATCTTALTAIAFRADLHQRILRLLEQQPDTHVWLRANAHLTLPQLLLGLFPMASCTGLVDAMDWRDMHLTTILCGAFTSSQVSAASKTLGFPRAADSHATMLQLRLLCVERIQQHYASRKQAEAAAALIPPRR